MRGQMATSLQEFFPPSGNDGILFMGSKPAEQFLPQLVLINLAIGLGV